MRKIGVRGFTYGKANGTGLGLFYAKRLIEDLGGKFNIESAVNKGTIISMSLPISNFVMPNSINFGSSEHILILEDQALIRDTVRFKFNNSGVPANAYSIFSTPSELENWMTTNNSNFKLYSDYSLENDRGEKLENGVDIIKRLGIADRSCLFTSAFNEPEVIRAAQGLGIPVLSKDQFFGLDIKLRSM